MPFVFSVMWFVWLIILYVSNFDIYVFQLYTNTILSYSSIFCQYQLDGSKSVWIRQLIFLNSLTSIRVFTGIVSDNLWCSLLAIFSIRWEYNVTFTHCIPNHSRPEWMTINRFFLKWLWNLINFKKLFKLTNRRHIFWESAHILHSLQGVNMKVTNVHKLMWKNTNWFFAFQDSSIPDV